MKKTSHPALRQVTLWFLALYLVVTLVPPLLYYALPGDVPPEGGASSADESSVGDEPAQSPAPAQSPGPDRTPLPGPLDEPGEGFALRDADGSSLTVSTREFLIGDLACEMDPHAPLEALKAQAVAALTYYTRLTAGGGEIPCDTGKWQVYVTGDGMRERWGEDYEEYRATLEKAVDEVSGQTLTYRGEPILAAYFAISSGSTEAVWNVWAEDSGEDHPYLQAVASPGDALADGYLSSREFTADELKSALEMPDLSGSPASWFGEPERTPSGMVKSVDIGGRTFTGPELRAALGLRSACFTWEERDGKLAFTVRGWGHGVGMSQAGAAFMAKSGAGYREILRHYYPGAEVEGG